MTADTRPSAALSGPARVGRRVAALIYWALLAYVVVVGFYSIPKQIFAPAAASLGAASCRDTLIQLESDLLQFAADQGVRGGTTGSREARERFLSTWDARFFGADASCEPDARPALAPLARLRYRVETSLAQQQIHEAPLVRMFQRELHAPRAAETQETP